ELKPAFSGVTDKYTVTVDADQETVEISATAVSASSSVGGVGTYPIQPGENTLYVGCKAQNGAVKAYTITVIR
ncbi:MAG: cadherin-like beta sandwich domain-containing protein, partial [Lachnospiraceae bacterium]|nr:cadherin-like beta sandwich domain-containing protein [Lachnospiraceae bacterium]